MRLFEKFVLMVLSTILIVGLAFVIRGEYYVKSKIPFNSGGGGEEVTLSTGDKIILTGVYNTFTHEDGLFSFSYKNNYEVREVEGVFYLRDLTSKDVVFQIFQRRKDMAFDESKYECERDDFGNICYSSVTPDGIVKGINTSPDLVEDYAPYEFLNRGQALKWILELKYPKENFSRYSAGCFDDVSASDDFSGHICYAKNIGLVHGIGGKFGAENTVNLWGVVRLLFDTFGIDDQAVDMTFVDDSVFELMGPYHWAYPLLRKGYQEGLFENVTGEGVWSNRNVGLREANQIINNFVDWKNGKVIRDYEVDDVVDFTGAIYMRDPDRNFAFESCEVEGFKAEHERDAFLVEKNLSVDAYVDLGGGVREYLHTLDKVKLSNIESFVLDFNEERMKVKMLVRFRHGEDRCYKLNVGQYDFLYLKSNNGTKLSNKNLLPNVVEEKPHFSVPVMKVFMSEYDFESIFETRTSNERYPAYLEMAYPDGDLQSKSVLIKTRGNAHRGFIKSSFTIESFTNFDENSKYHRDEFLQGIDEVKLRSHVGDEDSVTEKLMYRAFATLGYPEPEFFEVFVELNGVPMGLYQVTEPVTKGFFERRGINVGDYYYADNKTSAYSSNMAYHANDTVTLAHYEVSGSEERFLDLVQALDRNDVALLNWIDVQNVFDFAMMKYITYARDSFEHNYFVYFDEDLKKWRMFFWDADTAFEKVPSVSASSLYKDMSVKKDGFNNLVYFVFRNMTDGQLKKYYNDFVKRWNESVDLVGKVDWYLENYSDLFEYDNALWNGKFLEREDAYFDTVGALKKLRSVVSSINKLR
ncbi:hypothetical protein HOE67_01820 [Candidatus Peregrinibacteria bacterium]|jgi:hypothetical protein|nr:hypothetical protein [Candidatus Peregrinibacteria bacterium]MBT4055825.1 hypothetical protein [Candidatus Peregrinibacteria bacterium]